MFAWLFMKDLLLQVFPKKCHAIFFSSNRTDAFEVYKCPSIIFMSIVQALAYVRKWVEREKNAKKILVIF